MFTPQNSPLEITSMDIVGIGAIGCGNRIGHLLKLLTQQSKQVRLEAICDPSEQAAANCRAQFNPEARIYSDYRKLIADPAVKWVLVGSWNCFHREHAVAALKT